MTDVIIAHGIGGHPGENWFPWLKASLTERGFSVHVPHFRTVPNLRPEDWWDALRDIRDVLTRKPILVGHSLGVAFLLSVLERHAAKAAYFVAPAWGKTNNEYTPIMAPIADRPFDWTAITGHCNRFRIYHSDTDPYLPLERADTLAEHLHCSVTMIPGAGHFNAKAGYLRFDRLLDDIVAENE